MLYIVPNSCDDDLFWMYATVSDNHNHHHNHHYNHHHRDRDRDRDNGQSYVVTNDLMRDHKFAFRSISDKCFTRWRENCVMHFDFSSARIDTNTNDNDNDNESFVGVDIDGGVNGERKQKIYSVVPDVMFLEPDAVSREVQRDGRALETARIHIPASDRSSWGCFNMKPKYDKRDHHNTEAGTNTNTNTKHHYGDLNKNTKINYENDLLKKTVDLFTIY